MTFNLLDAATLAARAAEAHLATGCTTCRPGARLAELCADGHRAALEAVGTAAPALLEPECPHGSWEVTSEHHTPDGWVKARKCADCNDPLPDITEPEPHWPAAALPAVHLSTAPPAPPGPARLAALMRSRQHWRGDRLVSEGTVSQAEIRDALGWTEPDQAPAITWTPGRHAQLRQLVHVITAGPASFPDLTDEWLVGKAREVIPELLDLTERLAARVEELEARGCTCYAPTAHVAGCVKAATRFNGRSYPAAVWYQDPDGEWWLPVAVDSRGCPVLQLDGDPAYGPAALDDLEAEYGRLTATVYGAHLERRDLPEGTGADAARRAVRLHLQDCATCRPEHRLPQLCATGQELTLAAAAAIEEQAATTA